MMGYVVVGVWGGRQHANEDACTTREMDVPGMLGSLPPSPRLIRGCTDCVSAAVICPVDCIAWTSALGALDSVPSSGAVMAPWTVLGGDA